MGVEGLRGFHYLSDIFQFSIFVVLLGVSWGPAILHFTLQATLRQDLLLIEPTTLTVGKWPCSHPFHLPTETVPPPTPVCCPWHCKHWVLWSFVGKAPALNFRGLVFTWNTCSLCIGQLSFQPDPICFISSRNSYKCLLFSWQPPMLWTSSGPCSLWLFHCIFGR